MTGILGVDLISRELTITADGLSLRSLFLDRWIPFAGVESISVEVPEADGNELLTERATVRGHGQKIVLDSGMPGYRAVLDLLRKRASAHPGVSAVDDPELAG
jgi:hypothetical protein